MKHATVLPSQKLLAKLIADVVSHNACHLTLILAGPSLSSFGVAHKVSFLASDQTLMIRNHDEE